MPDSTFKQQQLSGISMGQSNCQKTKNLKMKALSALVFSAWAWPVVALDLGRLQILSGIGEPLRAEIEVAQASPEELRTLRAQLASPGAFSQAGMEFNPALNGVTANLQTRANGAPYIALNGRAPIQENFIDLILEAQTSSGKLTKNYALLLNAVNDRMARSNPSPVIAPPLAAIAPVVQEIPPQSPPSTTIRTVESPNPLNATSVELNAQSVPVYRFAPVDNSQTSNGKALEPRQVESSPLSAPASQATPRVPANLANNENRTITVRTGDTASRLALRYLSPNVSLDQMMLAMLKANPDAFIQGNVNLVKAGAVLRMPLAEEATQIPRAEARKTVIAQTKEFAEYARRLAESPLLVDSKNSRTMSGKVTSETAKAETPSPQQDKLTLSKSTIGADASEAKLAKEREAKDASDQLEALNKNLKELETLSQSLPSPAPSVASATPPVPPAVLPPSGSASPTVSQATPSSSASLQELTENKQLWAWGGGLLAAILLVAFWMRRKSDEPESVYAPSYDDISNTGNEPIMGQAADNAQVAAQMSAIDLNLQPSTVPTAAASFPSYAAPAPAAPPAAPSNTDDTEQSKLNLAAQLLAKGDKDLARALILSVVSSTHGDIKARAIQMLGQIR
jgi:pilus assembly protein FimV